MSNPVGELRKKKDKSDVEQSFLDFVDDKNLYIEEQNKLWEFWEKGGSPFVKELDKKGRAYYTTAKISDDGYYRFEDIPDTLNIYSKDPITQFLAEIAHGIQYSRKEDESLKDYKERYRNLEKKSSREYHNYGDVHRYGRKMDPRNLQEIFSYEKRGDEFPVESYLEQVPYGHGDAKWDHRFKEKILWEEYDKSTKLGKEGSKPTHEFEAHSIIQPELESELSEVRESIPGYKKDILSDIDMIDWLKTGILPTYVKTGIGMGIAAPYLKSLMDYVNEN